MTKYIRRLWRKWIGRRVGLSTHDALDCIWLGLPVHKTTWRQGVNIQAHGRFIYVYVNGDQFWKVWTPYASDFSPRARWEIVP